MTELISKNCFGGVPWDAEGRKAGHRAISIRKRGRSFAKQIVRGTRSVPFIMCEGLGCARWVKEPARDKPGPSLSLPRN